jgi:hypothetical protein
VPGEEEGDALLITNLEPSRRAAVVAVVRDATGFSEVEAESIVDTRELLECEDAAEARELKAELEAAGASIDYARPIADVDSDASDALLITNLEPSRRAAVVAVVRDATGFSEVGVLVTVLSPAAMAAEDRGVARWCWNDRRVWSRPALTLMS